MNTNKEKNVIEFYVLCNKLKNVIRTGWQHWEVEKDRLESVAEHIFGVQMLAIAMYSEYQYDINIMKVIYMLAVHELEEIIIGDLTEFQISLEEKVNKGHKAISIILENLMLKEEIESLILEFDERKTKEAIFAYHCDKLECDLQCKLYDEEGCVNLKAKKDKIRSDNKEKIITKIDNNEVSWSDLWLEHDRKKFSKDDNFISVLDYLKNNNI